METNKFHVYSELLNQCDKELDEIYHRYAMRHNLSDAALWILYALHYEHKPVTQSDLCNSWFFSRQTLNTALKSLEQQGILALIPLPNNRKSKQVVFTSEGTAFTNQVLAPLICAEEQVFAAFTDKENEAFIKLTQRRCALLHEFLEPESE